MALVLSRLALVLPLVLLSLVTQRTQTPLVIRRRWFPHSSVVIWQVPLLAMQHGRSVILEASEHRPPCTHEPPSASHAPSVVCPALMPLSTWCDITSKMGAPRKI
jgi:hypothetical protein